MSSSLPDEKRLTRFAHEFQRNSGSREMVEHEEGEWVRYDDVDALLHQIKLARLEKSSV